MLGLAIVPVLMRAGSPVRTFVSTMDITNLGPIGFIYLNLSLIVLIPASGLSIWIVHGVRPGFLSSVAGGIRWRWLLRCVAVICRCGGVRRIGPLVVTAHRPRPITGLALLIIAVVMTPLQAAGKEYFFRGWIMQNVGSWFSRPLVGLVVSLVVSAFTFSTLHLSRDPWVLGTIACLAVASGLAAWRTGGLKAGVVDACGQQHTDNNRRRLLSGSWSQAFVSTDTAGTPVMLLLAAAVYGGSRSP